MNNSLGEDDPEDEVVYPLHSAGELVPLEFESHVDVLGECSRVEAAPLEANGYCETKRAHLFDSINRVTMHGRQGLDFVDYVLLFQFLPNFCLCK